jgi:hypothetical protein
VREKIEMDGRPAAVWLHCWHLDQSEDDRTVEMKSLAISSMSRDSRRVCRAGWDIAYAIEAVDMGDAGSFYPDPDVRQAFVVTAVKSH